MICRDYGLHIHAYNHYTYSNSGTVSRHSYVMPYCQHYMLHIASIYQGNKSYIFIYVIHENTCQGVGHGVTSEARALPTLCLFKKSSGEIIGNRVISIAECLFIDKQDLSVIVIHTRQQEACQENAVTFSVYCY